MTLCSTLNDIKKCYLIQINPRLHMSWQQWAPLLFGRFFPVAPHQLYHRFVLMSSSTCLRRKDIVPDLVRRRTSCLSLLRIRLTYIGGKSYEREGEEICKKSLCLPVQGSRGGPGRKSLWSFPINRGNWRIGRAVTFSPSVKCLWPLYLPLLSQVCECGWGGEGGIWVDL